MAVLFTVTATAAMLPHRIAAQGPTPLPPSRADTLLEQGRWAEAESEFYARSQRAPRDPVARAALGRYIAMKGALRTGIVLLDEARQFGLDANLARSMITPLRAVLNWRQAALDLKRDSTIDVRRSSDPSVMFQMPLPRTGSDGRLVSERGRNQQPVLHDVVDRMIGLDSLSARGSPIGMEVFEALAPAMDVRMSTLTLHSNSRAALASLGRRYPVLRTQRGVWVQVSEGRSVRLAEAIRELSPSWWQLDLVHGILVVR